MAASYLRQGMDGLATFSLFVRRLPPSRGFLVAAGLEDSLSFLEGLHFDEGDLAWLAELDFWSDVVERFGTMRFTGDVHAASEGRIVFANERLLEVTAPIAEARLIETYLLNQISFQTSLATKAARRVLAPGNIELVAFALRRTQGVEAGMAVARASAIAGFIGTSNVEAVHRFGLDPAGTMAHSYIEGFPNEAAAFRAFATDLPGRATWCRSPVGADLLATRQEPGPTDTEALLAPVMRNGARVEPFDTTDAAGSRLARDLNTLPSSACTLHQPTSPEVMVSGRLQSLTDGLTAGLYLRHGATTDNTQSRSGGHA